MLQRISSASAAIKKHELVSPKLRQFFRASAFIALRNGRTNAL